MKYKEITKAINDSPFKVCLALAGGGQSFVQNFMQYSGASRTIADIRVPYGREAFEEFCGKPIDKFVSVDSARLLATKSYANCCKSVDPKYAIGIGVSCALAYDGEREGRGHIIIIVSHTYDNTVIYELHLRQGLDRCVEEYICCELIFEFISRASNVSHCINYMPDLTWIDEYLDYKKTNFNFYQRTIVEPETDNLVVMSGSFNPFHDGHKEMALLAEEILGEKPYLELTTLNADKGHLDFLEVSERLKTVSGYEVILTHARTFLDKAREFYKQSRIITFVVGADTWNRILDPKYAGEMSCLYYRFFDLNVKFLVFPRQGYEILYNEFMDHLRIKDPRTELHTNAISSTEIRNKETVTNE